MLNGQGYEPLLGLALIRLWRNTPNW